MRNFLSLGAVLALACGTATAGGGIAAPGEFKAFVGAVRADPAVIGRINQFSPSLDVQADAAKLAAQGRLDDVRGYAAAATIMAVAQHPEIAQALSDVLDPKAVAAAKAALRQTPSLRRLSGSAKRIDVSKIASSDDLVAAGRALFENARAAKPAPAVLAIDVGGTHVKVLATGRRTPLKIDSGPTMTAARMAREVKKLTQDWKYDRVSIGYPGPVQGGKPARNPANLGGGWTRFDFAKAFGAPVKVINDAAMQALGSYRGGRMLFLGLGTGLGSALIIDGRLQPLELAHLPYKNGKTYEDYVGLRGLEKYGKKKWRKHVFDVVDRLKTALQADYVVLGGGNVKKLKELPSDTIAGDNANAFKGGFRLWAIGRNNRR